MRTLFIFTVVLLIAAVKPVTQSDFDKKVLKKKDRVVVVKFEAEWCAPCQVMKPRFKALAKQNRDVDFLSVDVDTQPSLNTRWDVSQIPATLIFVNGKKVKHHVGLASQDQLKRMVRKAKDSLSDK